MRALVAFLFLLVAGAPHAGAQRPHNGDVKALEKIIADAVRKHQPVGDSGIAVAVMKDRKLFYSGGLGLRDRSSRALVDVDTVFAIGSATKSFTSMALSMLMERNALVLSAPIKQYLNDFGMLDADALEKMTLEDILSHRTGLPRHDALWYFPPFGRSQLVHRLRHLDPNTLPGMGFRKIFSYSNLMYSAGGYVLEAVTGTRWEEFVKSNILDPLQMPNASFTVADLARAPNGAKGYLGEDEMLPRDFANIGPAGAMNANVRELANWVLLHLNRGTAANGTKIADAATLEKMYDTYIDVDTAHSVTYGLGWFVSRGDSKRLVFHGGNGEGYTAYMSFMPDDGVGVIALTNQHAAKFPALVARAIYEHLLPAHSTKFQFMTEMRRTELAELMMAAPEVEVRRLPKSPKLQSFTGSASDYVGMFSHPGYGDLSVSKRGNDLLITYYQQGWELQRITTDLYYFSTTAFGASLPLVPVMFNRTSTGQVDKVSIPLEPAVKPIQFIKR